MFFIIDDYNFYFQTTKVCGASFFTPRDGEGEIFWEGKPGRIKRDTRNIQRLRSVWIAESLNDHPGDSRLSCSSSPPSPVSLPSLAFFHLRRAAPLLGPFAARCCLSSHPRRPSPSVPTTFRLDGARTHTPGAPVPPRARGERETCPSAVY